MKSSGDSKRAHLPTALDKHLGLNKETCRSKIAPCFGQIVFHYSWYQRQRFMKPRIIEVWSHCLVITCLQRCPEFRLGSTRHKHTVLWIIAVNSSPQCPREEFSPPATFIFHYISCMNTTGCCLEQHDDEQHAGNANMTSISSCKVERGENKKVPNPHSEHFLDSFMRLFRLLFRLQGWCGESTAYLL